MRQLFRVMIALLCAAPVYAQDADAEHVIAGLLEREQVELGFDQQPLAEAVDAIQGAVWFNLVLDARADPSRRVSVPPAQRSLNDLLAALAAAAELESTVWCGVVLLHPQGSPPPAPPAAALQGGLPGYTLNCRAQPGSEALALLSDLAGVELLVPSALDEQAARPITLRIRNLPLAQALTLVAHQLGLSWQAHERGASLIPRPVPEAGDDEQSTRDRLERVRLTLQLVESPLDEALETLSSAGDVSIRLEAEFEGTVRLQLRNTPLREAFDALAEQTGLVWRVEGNTVVVHASAPR